ncbi:MAG: CBS domain-containing protein [Chloroflexia bacterium]
MVEQGVKRLPVVDREGKLIGIVGRLDILRAWSGVTAATGPEPGGPVPANARTVGDVMATDVAAVEAGTPMQTVMDMLVGSRSARRVVVVDRRKERHVAGIITDADLVKTVPQRSESGLAQVLRERLPWLGMNGDEQAQASRVQSLAAADVMTTPVVTAPKSMAISVAAQLMVERGVKVLPITDEEGRLVGVVNRARLLAALLGQVEGG